MNLSGLKNSYANIIGWHNLPNQSQLTFTGPSLFIRGADSNYVTAEHSDGILRQFPQAQAKTLAGCSHWLHAQKPAIFNRIVSEFIDKHTV